MVDRKSADAQRHARFEDVRVKAKSDPCFHGYRACSFSLPAAIPDFQA
jgi:hypothetical protein